MLKIRKKEKERYIMLKGLKVLKKDYRKHKERDRINDWWTYRFPGLMSRSFYTAFRKNSGIYVLDEDWDNLIILDACRFDLFKEVLEEERWVEGELQLKESRGSYTKMFLRENFSKRKCGDLVYVSPNPIPGEFKESYRFVYVRDENDESKSIHPEIMLKASLEAIKRYPDKRIIFHFVQPHIPYINSPDELKNPFAGLARGEIDLADAKRAYKENLKLVLPAVKELVDNLEGKTVISADHGEAFGEWASPFPIRIWGHNGPRIRCLREVPWFVVKGGKRKTIKKGFDVEEKVSDEEEMKRRLNNLGYF